MSADRFLGQRFGSLVVIEIGPIRGSGKHRYYLCQCDCGNMAGVAGNSLVRGTKSCGCAHSRRPRETYAGRHREAPHRSFPGTPEYVIWGGMKSRCHNQNHPSYANYGGRGITVCAEWRDSFEAFLADMGRRPSPEHSLDRIDNDGNYEPGNVRWATNTEQSRNRRNNHWIEVDGVRRTLADWAVESGISLHTIKTRLSAGWDPARAVTEPPQAGRRAIGP
jgi:hypothetical protein